MSTHRLHQLTERLSSLFRAELRSRATANGLKLIQLEALIYLGMANRYSDTLLAMTDYFAVTKGTMSQTLKALVTREFVSKIRDSKDGRVTHCVLTAQGRSVVEESYPAPCFEGTDISNLNKIEDGLELALRALQRGNQFKSFGLCKTCRFFEKDGSKQLCGLTKEALSESDSTKICREHEIAAV
ncbi:MAG: winged helix DNA-binding protein [Planctomycetota bacterium]|nr:winged helix DNA-binding protein [Planctomycetota bacterium]